ncbi:MAG: hypothetical protein IPK52_06905 [Chloroflexi bacterium]|nr:hypothetical protein [Chloroflexota bacterium]
MRYITLCAFVVVALVLTACTGGGVLPYTLAAESMLPEFLHDAAPTVREAYRFAIENAHELGNYPCYCGCGKMGHTSNLDCYIQNIDEVSQITFDQHAAGCGICVDITQDAMHMLREGRSSAEIRVYVDATYSAFGPSTDTPTPEG